MKIYKQMMFLAFSFIILSCSETSQEDLIKKAEAPLLDGMGIHTHKVTTNRASQKYFNQGLILSFAFNHAESIRSFKAAQRLDPNCAMCYWGEALSRGPNINVTSDGKVVMSPQDRKDAFKAIEKAKELMPSVSAKEQDYILALASRYNGEIDTDRSDLDVNYALAMQALSQKYPDDMDAASLFAESLMNTMPWNYWAEDGNPKPDTILEEGDEAIVIAEDDSTIHFFEQPVVVPTELSYSTNKVLPKIEKYLIFGWNRKLPILVDEYSGYIHDGSVIDIIVPRKSDAMERIFQQLSSKHPKVRMTLQQVNPSMSNFPGRLYPHRYDNVIIMAGENGTTEEIDSETISMLLKFRHFFREVRVKGEEVHTQLITEVMDSANAQIIQQSGVKDFLVSNQFVSKMMAQISEDPDVNLVYEDLFREDGSEIYLKPAWLYFENLPAELSFADIMLAAQKRDEVCFGLKIKSEEYEPKFGINIIPKKEEVFTLEEGDMLIVLAEDEY